MSSPPRPPHEIGRTAPAFFVSIALYFCIAVMLTCILRCRNRCFSFSRRGRSSLTQQQQRQQVQESRELLTVVERDDRSDAVERTWWQIVWRRWEGIGRWGLRRRVEEKKEEGDASRTTTWETGIVDQYGTFAGFDGVYVVANDVMLSGAGPHSPGASYQAHGFSERYTVIRTLDHTNEGLVHLVSEHASGENFIIKQIPRSDATASWPNEADIFINQMSCAGPRHPNIVRLREAFADDAKFNLVLEYCDAGDLWTLTNALARRNEFVPRMVVLHVISSMVDALSCLHWGKWYDADADRVVDVCEHQGQILHRDIKLDNIFLRWSDRSPYGLPDVVLGDFGMAATAETNVGCCGVYAYWAPEIRKAMLRADGNQDFNGKINRMTVHSPQTDMYALGATVWELITGESFLPHDTDIRAELEYSDCAGDSNILSFIEGCLHDDPLMRPAADHLWHMSKAFKEEVRQWNESGGHLPAHWWPDAFLFEKNATARPSSSRYTAPRPTVSRRSRLLDRDTSSYPTMSPYLEDDITPSSSFTSDNYADADADDSSSSSSFQSFASTLSTPSTQESLTALDASLPNKQWYLSD